MITIEQLLILASNYEDYCSNNLVTESRIRNLPNGNYRVLSEKKQDTFKKLQEVEFFKHKDDNTDNDNKVIDLRKATDFSFSAIMREMRQQATKEQLRLFLTYFKKEFDKAVKSKLQKPEKVSLQNSLIKFNKKYKVQVNKKLIKNAAVSELGDPVLVGKYLSDIVKFTINRIPLDKRTRALDTLRKRFYSFNANEISQKNLPPTSGIGQSITFVKHVLFNHDPHYIREVLNNLVKNL